MLGLEIQSKALSFVVSTCTAAVQLLYYSTLPIALNGPAASLVATPILYVVLRYMLQLWIAIQSIDMNFFTLAAGILINTTIYCVYYFYFKKLSDAL